MLLWKTRRSLAEETVQNSTLILAEKRTHREDPLDDFKKYQGGWNISNKHYWAVSFSVFLLINFLMRWSFFFLPGFVI